MLCVTALLPRVYPLLLQLGIRPASSNGVGAALRCRSWRGGLSAGPPRPDVGGHRGPPGAAGVRRARRQGRHRRRP
jgi:hypothetical protein